MRPSSETEFDWIRAGRDIALSREDPSWKGNFVSRLLPPQFDAYAKVLHQINANYENVDHPLTDREIEILRIPPCTELRSFVEQHRKENKGTRIRWRPLADLFGVPFAPAICHEWFRTKMNEPQCWPRFLYGPADSALYDEEWAEVISVLRPFTGTQDVLIRFAVIPFLTADNDRPPFFRGSLDEVADHLAQGKYQYTPEYWWAADRSWCLCTEFDLTFTIIAGSKELVSAVLANPTLESLEVTSQTRIDDFAPMP